MLTPPNHKDLLLLHAPFSPYRAMALVKALLPQRPVLGCQAEALVHRYMEWIICMNHQPGLPPSDSGATSFFEPLDPVKLRIEEAFLLLYCH